MKEIYYAFEVAEGYGVLRYVMRYLQWDHGIEAPPFLHSLLDSLQAVPGQLPVA